MRWRSIIRQRCWLPRGCDGERPQGGRGPGMSEMAADSLGEMVRRMRTRLRTAGVDTASLDARLLGAAAADCLPDQVVLDPDRPVDAATLARAEAMLARRLAGEPVGRILGRREFWGLDLGLSADTLEPRADTETLVEAVLTWCGGHGGAQHAWRFADLGTGTGAIALALLSELPNAVAVAIDLSPGALGCARDNAARHGLADRFLPVQGDFAGALAPGLDFLVSNPPYIREGDRHTLDIGVRGFDPDMALFAGADGMTAYRAIFGESSRLLAPAAPLFLEIGHDQAAEVAALARAAGRADIAVFQDLGGCDRVVRARGVAK